MLIDQMIRLHLKYKDKSISQVHLVILIPKIYRTDPLHGGRFHEI